MDAQSRSTAERSPSLGEEIAHSISHGAGLLATLVAGPALIVRAVDHGKPGGAVGASVFATSILLLYLASTLYHALPQGRAKRVFRILEHGAIFLLIAGTYTPITVVAMRGPWGWTLLAVVWTLAIVGILGQALAKTNRRWLPGVLYLTMAWLIVFAIRPLSTSISFAGLLWLVAGGIAYTAGMAFFSARSVPYCHFVWHLFVLAGTTFHFVAIWGYVV